MTGWPYFQNNDGNPVVWYTTQPQYFTDPGDLSAYVNHAAADALVAEAAATWNNSLSSIVLGRGGALNEHVSGANLYLGSSGPVFPSDVQASNYLAKPIAVIYDSDGSVTDTLLGGGASDPGNCRQSAVTESVDSIATNGQIQHALIILNGRCTGSAAEVQLEMKYKLVRAFGRVLGLGWSQLNDNVFTRTPQPTSQQVQNWPIMHPIDLLCGPYAYQCVLQPFTLRTDDISALVSMYPVSTSGNGKTPTYANASWVNGFVSFANGQPMEGLLVSVRRSHFGPGYVDAFDVTSSVTGYSFQQIASNPMTPKGSTVAASSGSTNPYFEGYYNLAWVPVPTTDYFDGMTVTTSAINPLYTGQYAVGPYAASQVTPSGPAMTNTESFVTLRFGARLNMTSTSAPTTCDSGGDGTEGSPLGVASTGFWSDTLCGYQHSAWSSLPIKAGRSLTMEVTALNEQGYATTGKMLPVLGAWDSSDPAGSLPSLASQAAALNASTLGMTNLRLSTSASRTLRLAVADQRGDGRPDYGYNARILYADSISPASLPANGGVVTIAGMGFRPGNTVTINGIQAAVSNWTSTSITLLAPAITGPLAVDVVVTDLATGAQSAMFGALTYSQTALPNLLSVVAKPTDGGFAGMPGSPSFKVRVMLPDGITPASGVAVTLSSASATFSACSGAPVCIVTTDSTGIARSPVTPTVAGTVTLSATAGGASISASFVAVANTGRSLSVVSMPSGTVYATLPAATPFKVRITLPDGVTAAAGVTVSLTAGNATLGACPVASSCTLVADAAGTVSTTVTPTAAGIVSLLATSGGGMVSASFGATALPADVLRVQARPVDGSYVGRTASPAFAVQVLLGDNATPASGTTVTVSASGATLTACQASTCTLTTDATGTASTTLTPTAPGTVVLMASAGGGSVATSFSAMVVPADTLRIISSPSNGTYMGSPALLPFTVSILLADGTTPAPGVPVNINATGASFGACGLSTCTVMAGLSGTISTTVTATSAGTVTLSASAGGGAASSTFTAIPVPDTLQVISSPSDHSFINQVAAMPYTVQARLGVLTNGQFQALAARVGAPAAGELITLTANGARLNACGLSTCTLTADAMGTVSTTVTPVLSGTITLLASAGGTTFSSSFMADTPPDALRVASAPANGSYASRTAPAPFSVQVLLGDGTTPASGASVTLTATGATLGFCGLASCVIVANASGIVSTTVTPSAPGTVQLTASSGGGTVATAFTAVPPPDILVLVAVPPNESYVGRTASAFAVRVFQSDGVTPASNISVSLTASGATLGACAQPTCVVTTNATGKASTAVTPNTAGTVLLYASAGGGTVTASFNAAIPPDILRITSTPSDGTYTRRPASSPFALQVLLGDGATPASGATVTLTAAGATLAACGLSSCPLTADAAGMVSSAVTPQAGGTVSLFASAGGGTVSTSFTAVEPVRTISFSRSTEFVATGSTATWMPVATLLENGVPAQGIAVTWTGTAGLALTAPSSTTDAYGAATLGVTLGPLASGAAPTGSACAWSTVCATFRVQAADDSTWRLVAVAGDDQAVAGSSTLQPLVLRAVDNAGHWIAGVPVQVHQTLRGYAVCPRTGRCPVAPVLSTADSTVLTDGDGLASIIPLQMANTAGTTGIVAAAGQNGYLSLSLVKVP